MRRSGRTTRAVDEAIQKLFTEGQIHVPLDREEFKEESIIDPDANEHNKAQRVFRTIIIERLDLEHRGQWHTDGDYIKVLTSGD